MALGLDELLRQLDGGTVKGCVETGRKGTFTLTLEITPKKNAIEVAPKIEAKVPRAALNGGIFFADDEGGLHRNNPKQVELPLKSVPAPATELRTVKKDGNN